MDITNMLVFDKERNIDVEATVSKFRSYVVKANEIRRNDQEVIAKGVDALFDQYPGTFIMIDAIKSMVLQTLKVHPNSYGVLSDRLHKYVQENTEVANGLTEDGQPALFVLKKGKGGGFARKRDLPTPPTA